MRAKAPGYVPMALRTKLANSRAFHALALRERGYVYRVIGELMGISGPRARQLCDRGLRLRAGKRP